MRAVKIYAGQLVTILLVVTWLTGLCAYVKSTDLETVQLEAVQPIESLRDHSGRPPLPAVMDEGVVTYGPSHPYYKAFNGRYVSPGSNQAR